MEEWFKALPQWEVEPLERLKRDYIESTFSLVESFARQAARYTEQGDEEAALKARSNCELFCQLALDMMQRLEDHQDAEIFLERLKRVGFAPKGSRYVA